jgi:hypothetical protein
MYISSINESPWPRPSFEYELVCKAIVRHNRETIIPKGSFAPTIVLMNVLEPSQESAWSYIYVLAVSIVLLSTNFLSDFGIDYIFGPTPLL